MNHRMDTNTDWFQSAKWGVMWHFLADQPSASTAADMTVERWNALVDGFDIPALVQILKDAKAGYLLFTIGQCSGFFCSPNATYDGIVGVTPSRLSKRDLIGELADALDAVGIPFMAYLPSHAPSHHREAVEALRFTPAWDPSKWGLKPGTYSQEKPVDDRLSEAQQNWEAVIREWSLRWGRKVRGWWIDGCYYADRMYRHPDAPNFQSFASALKSGNPESIVAFNPGVVVPVIRYTECDDYTAGESNVMVTPNRHHPFDRFIDGAQFHVLSYLGNYWCHGNPRYPDALVSEYTRYINSFGGVVTWDVPLSTQGSIPEAFITQLNHLGSSV